MENKLHKVLIGFHTINRWKKNIKIHLFVVFDSVKSMFRNVNLFQNCMGFWG